MSKKVLFDIERKKRIQIKEDASYLEAKELFEKTHFMYRNVVLEELSQYPFKTIDAPPYLLCTKRWLSRINGWNFMRYNGHNFIKKWLNDPNKLTLTELPFIKIYSKGKLIDPEKIY